MENKVQKIEPIRKVKSTDNIPVSTTLTLNDLIDAFNQHLEECEKKKYVESYNNHPVVNLDDRDKNCDKCGHDHSMAGNVTVCPCCNPSKIDWEKLEEKIINELRLSDEEPVSIDKLAKSIIQLFKEELGGK